MLAGGVPVQPWQYEPMLTVHPGTEACWSTRHGTVLLRGVVLSTESLAGKSAAG